MKQDTVVVGGKHLDNNAKSVFFMQQMFPMGICVVGEKKTIE